MRLSAMGDVAMTVPVLASFLATYPDVQITLLSNPRFVALFNQIPRVSFIPVDTKKQYAGNFGMLRLYKDLKSAYRFDAMIDLHDVLRSKILRMLFRFSSLHVYVIDKGRKEKKWLVSEKNTQKKQLKSSIQRYADVFARAGFPFDIQEFRMKLPAPSIELKDFLSSKKGCWIGVAPFAQHRGKIYPVEKTEKVVAHYSEKDDVQVLLFGGGESEKNKMSEWEKKYKHTISLAGKYNLQEELSIMEQCDVVLSMDSANMHLASLVHTPVVSIWGATHPYAGFYGFGQDAENAVQVDMPCRPCSIYGNKACKFHDYPCLKNISEEEVIGRVDYVLETLERHDETKD